MDRIQATVSIPSLGSWIGLQTRTGMAALQEKTGQWTADAKRLRQKSSEFAILQATLKRDPALATTLHDSFSELQAIETDLETVLTTPSDLEQEAFQELLFLKDWSKSLNFVPYLLAIWSIVRVYVLPGMSMLLPVVMLLLPFIILRFLFNIPITAGRYSTLVSSLFSGQIGGLFQPMSASAPPPAGPFDISQLFKSGFLVITVVQSFLQPYWSFQHLYSIDTIVQTKASSLKRFQELYDRIRDTLQARGFDMMANPFQEGTEDTRQLVAAALLDPPFLKYAYKRLGALEVLFRLASHPDLVTVQWTSGATASGATASGATASVATASGATASGATASGSPSPSLELVDTFDYRVAEHHRVPFTIRLGSSSPKGSEGKHALLTGPNRGGKSTTLRALTTAALLAHTYGCAPGRSARMSPFHTLFVCLTPEDLPGEKSRFEREIEFTASTLALQKGATSLVLLDELYHSTNPPDAEQACRLYTDQLWARPGTLSVISTHLFEFVEKAPASIQRLCCPATLDDSKNLHYSYRLEKGLCRVSSVDELLKENGLIR